MGIYLKDSAINAEAGQTVSRQSVRRLIQASDAITAATSETAQNRLLSEARSAGVPVSASSPFYVYRTDRGELWAHDGSSWNPLTPGLVDQRSLPFTHQWTVSGVFMKRIGGIVFCEGVLKNGGTIPAGQSSNIGVVPNGWIPASIIYGGSYAASITRFVNGGTPPFRADSTMWIQTSNGNINIQTQDVASEIRISAHWMI